MNYRVAKGLKIRMIIVLALLGIGAGGIVARAVQLQILEAPKLKELANRQHRHTIEIKAKRGAILDAKGETLAVSREEAQVFARPEAVEGPAETAARLASLLKLDLKVLKKKLASPEPFVWISRSVTMEQAEAVKLLDLKGIGLLPASRRFYPGRMLASNLLGFTGLDGEGLEGFEFYYNDLLAGKPFRLWLERDARGNPIFLSDRRSDGDFFAASGDAGKSYRQLFEDEPAGHSLKLTILRSLQYIAERELEKGVREAEAKSGCVVAMDPETGKILAMASYPTFDPNEFGQYPQDSYRNRAVVSSYEPGSTFKVFVISAALEEGFIQPTDRIYCENGTYVMGKETISDTKPHGWLPIEQIVSVSSNIGALKVGEKMGKQNLYQAVKTFGFGEKIGIDFPGELPGLVRPPEQWSQVAVGTVSFGQGVAVTPLQMTNALCAIANGGKLMKPCLVEAVVKNDGREEVRGRPQTIRRVLSPETARIMTGFMEKVTRPGGTGTKAAVPGYSVAGKTGTAQKSREGEKGYAEGLYVASFMGFLPASRPKLAMIVIVEEPSLARYYGGAVAAPIFQAIAAQAMVLLKVPAEDESASIARVSTPVPAADQAAVSADKIRHWEKARESDLARAQLVPNDNTVMPEVRGLSLRQALRALEGLPLLVEVQGSGIVIAQTPVAGTALTEAGPGVIVLEAAP